MVDCPIETCPNFVDLTGQFCSAECYSEWLAVRLYEATEEIDPFAYYQVVVPIKLSEDDVAPQPLVLQPWYHAYVQG